MGAKAVHGVVDVFDREHDLPEAQRVRGSDRWLGPDQLRVAEIEPLLVNGFRSILNECVKHLSSAGIAASFELHERDFLGTAPADQKISAIVTLLNKLVEQRKATNEQAQQTPAPKKEERSKWAAERSNCALPSLADFHVLSFLRTL